MTADDLRPLLTVDPFEPFTIMMAGGNSYNIVRPERVSLAKAGCLEIINPDGRWALLVLRHVVSITFPDVPVIR